MSTKIIRILAAERKNEEMVPNVTKVRAFFFLILDFIHILTFWKSR